MDIRDEQPDDVDTIRLLTQAAFKDAEHSSQTEAAIVDALRDAGVLTLSLVAVDDDQIVGHVAFSPVTIDGNDIGWYGLGPVSVWPERQRKGIGKALILNGIERLKQLGARGCVVLGDPDYYGRFGFVSDGSLRYGDIPSQYIQGIGFGGALPDGEVAYHRGFDAS